MRKRNNVSSWNCDWIISVTNSENANVNMFRMFGNKEEVAEKLAGMAVEDEVCASKTKEEYYDEIDDTEMHQLQLVAYEDGDYERISFVYTAVEFSSVNIV